MPGPAAATPIIWGKHIFLSSVNRDKRTLVALCLDRADGRILWNEEALRQTTAGRKEGRNTYATPTPATDGERVYAVSTEEFLGAVRSDPRFPREVHTRLAAFLEAADLVKFAAHRPTQPVVEAATGTARDYIETDARQADAAGAKPA